jgi:hypothetical protein
LLEPLLAFNKEKARLWAGLFTKGFGGFLLVNVFVIKDLFDGTTACEKPLFRGLFVFEHFFYSVLSNIL